ncbi:hypothetical protein AAKU64_003430 [Undibacterium sp. GrIS 1.8]|uniref:hypothetical protein n=1 Tax=unclassified Undibacterium TaxID=2630295 RepID=UPI00339AE80E
MNARAKLNFLSGTGLHSVLLCALLSTVLGTLLSACKIAPQQPDPNQASAIPVAVVVPPQAVIASDNEDLLAYFQRARLLPSTELPKMLADLNGLEKGIEKKARHDVQRAILLGFIRGSGDLMRAQALLDGVVKSTDADAEHIKPLAYFLSTNYAEWRRLDEALDKQTQQLKESQRRADQLSQKLEDLKAIERQLPTRPRSAVVAPATSDNKQ